MARRISLTLHFSHSNLFQFKKEDFIISSSGENIRTMRKNLNDFFLVWKLHQTIFTRSTLNGWANAALEWYRAVFLKRWAAGIKLWVSKFLLLNSSLEFIDKYSYFRPWKSLLSTITTVIKQLTKFQFNHFLKEAPKLVKLQFVDQRNVYIVGLNVSKRERTTDIDCARNCDLLTLPCYVGFRHEPKYSKLNGLLQMRSKSTGPLPTPRFKFWQV